jgi:hypothetical protein
VQVAIALRRENIIRASGQIYKTTESGSRWLNDIGIESDELQLERRLFATQCLDFTERRPHLGGALGAALLERMIALEWVVKSRVPRALRVTLRGKSELNKRLGVEFTEDQNLTPKLHQHHSTPTGK